MIIAKKIIKKMVIIISSLIFLIYFLDRFSAINVRPHVIYNNYVHKNTPSLKQSLNNEVFTLEKLLNTTGFDLLYDNVNDFYLINNFNNVIKLDKNGTKVFELNLRDKPLENSQPEPMEHINASSYILSWHGIYDVSKENPVLEKFDTILHKNKELSTEQWLKKFNELYTNASVVLYGYFKAIDSSTPIYFKQNEKWTVLYEHERYGPIFHANTIRFRIKGVDFPVKYRKLFLLKDVQKQAYSNYLYFNSTNEEFIENDLHYEQRTSLETFLFIKERYAQADYSFIPATFGGTAINKVNVGNSNFIFKTKAQKGAGFNTEKIDNYLYLFDVPTKFQTENSISFLFYNYPTNWNSDEHEGLYLIKKRNKIN